MAIFSIADLHLSESTAKPMDIFGSRWKDHRDKLINRWKAVVSQEDTVVIPGDISWAMTLEDAAADFRLIHSLPGRKLIGKGNHDFWWSTLSKMNAMLEENGIDSVEFMQNNAFEVEDYIVCGTRGWFIDEKLQNTVGQVDHKKIVDREVLRLRMCIDEAMRLKGDSQKPVLVYFHFPPVFKDFVCREIVDMLKEYGVTNCYYGHIHGTYNVPKTIEFEGISMTLISADFLDFIPMITNPCDL